MKINRNSWHYKIASSFGSTSDEFMDWYCKDICNYTKRIIKNITTVVIAMAIIFCLLYITADGLAWLLVGFLERFIFPDVGAGIFITIVLATLFVWSMYFLSDMLKNFFNKSSNICRSPSFVAEAYQAIKNRYCVVLEFTDKESVDKPSEI